MLASSFVAWVPSTVAPFCSLPRPYERLLYFISVQNHDGYLFIPGEMLHLLLHTDPGWHQDNPACVLGELAQGCLKDLSRQGLSSESLCEAQQRAASTCPLFCMALEQRGAPPAPAQSHREKKKQQHLWTSGCWTCDATNPKKPR